MRISGVLATLVVAAAVPGCSSSPKSQAALPPPPGVVNVTMDDRSFRYDKKVPPGRVVFRIHNKGTGLHNMVVLPLPDDLPPFSEQLKGGSRRVVEPFAAARALVPGARREFAVDLEPGNRYGVFCSVADADGKSHAVKGMNSEFRTGPGPRRPPRGDAPK